MSAVVFYYRRSEFTTDSEFTIVVFLVREGPLGSLGHPSQNPRIHWAKAVPKDLGDEILDFYTPHPREKPGGFLVANFLSVFPKKIRPKSCHPRNFRKLHHIPHGKEINLSPGTRSGGDFA